MSATAAVGAPLRKAKVVYTYEAENHDEVTVTAGDVVEVVEFEDKTGEEGWWKVRCGANEGLAPGNFVELLPVTAGEGCTQCSSHPLIVYTITYTGIHVYMCTVFAEEHYVISVTAYMYF